MEQRRRLLRGVREVVPVVLAVGAFALLLGACGSPAKVEVSAPASGDNGPADGVTVTGTGKVSGTPDTLTVSIGVSTKRPTVDVAVTDNAARTSAVTDAVKAQGVAASDIQTANYSVQPSFTFTNNTQVPDGYTVNNTVSVKLHDLNGAGGVIDAATAAGGDEATVQGVSFTLEDNQALLTQARDEAYADAKAKAEQLGSLSGRGIGDAQAINESTTFRPVGYAVADAATATSTPISPGTVDTDVTITVRFALG